MTLTVVDLFSGAGGASSGFKAHQDFAVIGAADKQLGKPSQRAGTECNKTYRKNIGINPFDVDLGSVTPEELGQLLDVKPGELDVLISCSPCTGFSRTNSKNHLSDDPRNRLSQKTGAFIKYFKPKFFFVENARELLRGNFSHHGQALILQARKSGYRVYSGIHLLTQFGLPQIRERALIVGTNLDIPCDALDLSLAWGNYEPDSTSLTVRNAIQNFPSLAHGETCSADSCHSVPSMTKQTVNRLDRIPRNGGSWIDLLAVDDGFSYLIPSMIRTLQSNKLGSYPDIYGRMWWDRPAPTIKRECSSPGNGRYCHPEQNRMCSARELSYLQGFPEDYLFEADSLSNMYRHIGDSVPPMVSYQYAELISQIIHSRKSSAENFIMPHTFATRIKIIERRKTAEKKILFPIKEVIAA
jgi:DNA (cytosine-5)-methyltransferase 1